MHWRQWEKHGETHINPTYLCCMTFDEEMPLENLRKHLRESLNSWLFFFNQMIDRTYNQTEQVLPNITHETPITLKTGAFPKQNLRTNKKKLFTYSLKCAPSFFWRSYSINMLGFSLLASPIDLNTSVTTVWHQSQIRWWPFLLFR